MSCCNDKMSCYINKMSGGAEKMQCAEKFYNVSLKNVVLINKTILRSIYEQTTGK